MDIEKGDVEASGNVSSEENPQSKGDAAASATEHGMNVEVWLTLRFLQMIISAETIFTRVIANNVPMSSGLSSSTQYHTAASKGRTTAEHGYSSRCYAGDDEGSDGVCLLSLFTVRPNSLPLRHLLSCLFPGDNYFDWQFSK